MTGYTPTVDDYAYILETRPGDFTDPHAARTVLDQVRGGSVDGHNDMRMDVLARNYRGAPITQSAVPPSPGTGDVFDPAFAAACVDCTPGEPCCLRAFEVQDASDASRKISWPVPEGGPNKLFVIAKDPYQGLPAARWKTIALDYDACKVGRSDRPRFDARGVAHPANRLVPSGTETTSTLPFQLPAVLAAVFPEEVLIALYVVGYALLASSYRSDGGATVRPLMCVEPPGGPIRVEPVPHINIVGQVEGSVGVTFYLDQVPSITAALSGNITGEVANHTLSYSGAVETKTAPIDSRAQGPVQNPILETVNKIFEKVAWLADQNDPYTASGGIPNPTRSSLSVTLTKTLDIAQIKLEGKSGTPDLELKVDPVTFRIQLAVTGKVDLIDILISRVPRLSDALRDARESFKKEGRPVQLKLRCELILSAEGGVQFSVENGASITITSAGDWEAAFGAVAVQFQADAKITGRLHVEAAVGVKMWFFDGAAEASATVSTGWHFGGRTRREGEERKTETLYWFEGLRVQGRYSVRAGDVSEDRTRATFGTGSDATTGSNTTTRSTTNRAELFSGSFDEQFFASEGGPDDWK